MLYSILCEKVLGEVPFDGCYMDFGHFNLKRCKVKWQDVRGCGEVVDYHRIRNPPPIIRRWVRLLLYVFFDIPYGFFLFASKNHYYS